MPYPFGTCGIALGRGTGSNNKDHIYAKTANDRKKSKDRYHAALGRFRIHSNELF